jgi:hypothetical protein
MTLPTKKFKRVIEDFVCENCGTRVEGDGYTNHCPSCLWSKHVDDKNPGDRASTCGGLMQPMEYYAQGNYWIIRHKCLKCGKEMNQKVMDAPTQLI